MTKSSREESTSKSSTDGRRLRTAQNRRAIIEAMFDLNADGILVPTAQEVADRSQLGIRTVFRHFSELECLFVEGDKLLHDQYAAMPKIVPEGSTKERAEQLISTRIRDYETFGHAIRSTLVQLWRYERLRKNYRKLISDWRKEMFRFLPELKDQDEAVVEAFELALSFESWSRLRHIKGLSKKLSKRVFTLNCCSLIDEILI